MNYISICRRPRNTKPGIVLTYHGRLPILKLHAPLSSWPMLRHVTIWKVYTFTSTRLIDTKLGAVLTSGRRFITQKLKSLPTSCLGMLCLYLISVLFNIEGVSYFGKWEWQIIHKINQFVQIRCLFYITFNCKTIVFLIKTNLFQLLWSGSLIFRLNNWLLDHLFQKREDQLSQNGY